MANSDKSKKEMSFLDHLEELRWLLVRSSAFILGGGAVAFIFSDFIFDKIIFAPKRSDFVTYQFFCKIAQRFDFDRSFCLQDLPFEIQNRTMDGQFSVLIWTCISAGFIIAVPFILWEIWKFISPALYTKEKKYAKLFIVVSSLLFFMGVVFGYYVITPLSINFLANLQVSDIVKKPDRYQLLYRSCKNDIYSMWFSIRITDYYLLPICVRLSYTTVLKRL